MAAEIQIVVFFRFFRRRDRYGDLLQRLALTWRRFG